MKFTVKWLKEYLIFDSSVEELCEKLTSIGLEVENLENPKDQLSSFIVSKIVDVKKHPNADKLSICNVFDGEKELEIVCGASNARKNLVKSRKSNKNLENLKKSNKKQKKTKKNKRGSIF